MPETAMVPVSEARSRIKDLIDDAARRPVMLIRHSRPAAVLLSPDYYQRLLTRIEELEDSLAILEHKLKPNDVTSWAKIKADIGLDS